MSRSIFIQNSTGLAASSGSVTNPNDVADGKIVFMDVAGGQIGLGAADAIPDEFLIVRGTADLARTSGIIRKKDIVRAGLTEYAAAVNQVTTVTPLAGTATRNGRARLLLTRIDNGFEQFPRVSYEIDVVEGDTPTQIAGKFRSVIEEASKKSSTINNPMRHFVVASGTATLVLTAKTVPMDEQGTPTREHISFVTSIEGPGTDDGWTIAATAAPTNGSGTYPQVFEYERRSFGNLGFYYTEHYPQVPASHAVPGTEYDIFTLEVKTNAERSINKSFMIHEYLFAVVAGQLDEDDLLIQLGLKEAPPSGGG